MILSLMGLALAACTTLYPQNRYARADLEFLARAINAEPPAKESMWASASSAPSSPDTELRLALMQSVPGHTGYNPDEAKRSLVEILKHNPEPEIAAVARARLSELKLSENCQNEVQSLRQRLSRVVDIERRTKDGGH